MKHTQKLSCLVLALVLTAFLLPLTVHADPLPTDEGCRGSSDGHNWQPYDYEQYPTCTEPGTYIYICLNCWETVVGPEGEIPPLGHSWDSGTVTREATCQQEGIRTYHCTRCGETKTETIPVTGHNWDEGVTTEASGFHTSQTTYTCRTCGETRTETAPLIPADFFSSLRNRDLISDAPHLVITKEPVGGSITRDPGDSLLLTVEVEGGSGEYFYEWHCESLDTGSQDTVLTAATLGLGSDLLEMWSGTATSWYNVHEDVFGDTFSRDWLQTFDGSDQAGGSLLDPLNIFDHDVGTSISPEYEATQGNCEYWVEITDSDGNTVTSEHVIVYYRIRIAEEPQNRNWETDADHDLQAVWLECKAADGSGDYQYEWYWDTDPTTPVDIHEGIYVLDLGYYICYVTDRQTGDVVKSQYAIVYTKTPLLIYSFTPSTTLWSDEEWTVQATVEFGMPPYTCWCEVNGEPLPTEYVGDDDQGRPIYEAVGTASGLYTFHATDDMGAEATVSTSRIDQFLTIAKQPQSGTLKQGEPGDSYFDLDVTMADGTPPYRYSLYFNGTNFVNRDSMDTTDGFRIYEPGVYYFIITDSEGHWVQSNDAVFEYEDFHFTDYTRSSSFLTPETGATLSVSVSGGWQPYTYEWLESNGSGGWKTYGQGEEAFTVRRPGFYMCKVTDAEGNTIRTSSIKVTYDGELPLILTQPRSGYQESAGERFTLSCHAIPGKGQGDLVYDWYRTEPAAVTGWTWVGSGKAYTSTVPGIYKCVVTDLSLDLYTVSEFATVLERLVITHCEIQGLTWVDYFTKDPFAWLDFTGGIGPYYVEVHKVGQGGNPNQYIRTHELANTRYKSGNGFFINPLSPYEWFYAELEDGTDISDSRPAQYYFVVIDSYGQSAVSEVLTVPVLAYYGGW